MYLVLLLIRILFKNNLEHFSINVSRLLSKFLFHSELLSCRFFVMPLSVKFYIRIFLCLAFLRIVNNSTEPYMRRHEDSMYIMTSTENVEILRTVHEKMRFLILTSSIQNFLERLIVMSKYYRLPVSQSSIQSFLLFVLDCNQYRELVKVKDYWIIQLQNDKFFEDREELTSHILTRYDDVMNFINTNFQTCQTLLMKVKKKQTYYNLLHFYGRADYPNIICLCFYLFDGLKFEAKNFNNDIYAQVLYDNIEKEAHYIGLELREKLYYGIDD